MFCDRRLKPSVRVPAWKALSLNLGRYLLVLQTAEPIVPIFTSLVFLMIFLGFFFPSHTVTRKWAGECSHQAVASLLSASFFLSVNICRKCSGIYQKPLSWGAGQN